jgi:hypothetical protein
MVNISDVVTLLTLGLCVADIVDIEAERLCEVVEAVEG